MAVLTALFYFFAGAAEWSIATLRTWHVARGHTIKVMIIVFFEEVLLVGVTAYIINNPKQWYLLLFAAVGGSLGAGICLKLSKGRRE
jgi:hypothetical protein